jgi:quinol-cytochrome oxidoreductase complex cytochrome b subunit
VPFFPNFLVRDAIGWSAAVGVLAALAALFPWDLGEKADPFAPAPAGIRPEWYFAWMFQTLKWLPAHVLGVEGELVGLFAFGVGGLLLILVPLLDSGGRPGRSHALIVLGWVVVVYAAAATAAVYLNAASG